MLALIRFFCTNLDFFLKYFTKNLQTRNACLIFVSTTNDNTTNKIIMTYANLTNNELLELFFAQDNLLNELEAQGESYIWSTTGISSTERYDKELAKSQSMYNELNRRNIDPFYPEDVEAVKKEAAKVEAEKTTEKVSTLQDVQRTREQFNNDLEDCLTIIDEPTKTAPYYFCEHISHALETRTVKVFVIE